MVDIKAAATSILSPVIGDLHSPSLREKSRRRLLLPGCSRRIFPNAYDVDIVVEKTRRRPITIPRMHQWLAETASIRADREFGHSQFPSTSYVDHHRLGSNAGKLHKRGRADGIWRPARPLRGGVRLGAQYRLRLVAWRQRLLAVERRTLREFRPHNATWFPMSRSLSC
jgi:hypothetical protein